MLQQGWFWGSVSAPGCLWSMWGARFGPVCCSTRSQWNTRDILPQLQLEQRGFGNPPCPGQGHRGISDVWLPLPGPVVRICRGVPALPFIAGTQHPCSALPVPNATPRACASPLGKGLPCARVTAEAEECADASGAASPGRAGVPQHIPMDPCWPGQRAQTHPSLGAVQSRAVPGPSIPQNPGRLQLQHLLFPLPLSMDG